MFHENPVLIAMSRRSATPLATLRSNGDRKCSTQPLKSRWLQSDHSGLRLFYNRATIISHSNRLPCFIDEEKKVQRGESHHKLNSRRRELDVVGGGFFCILMKTFFLSLSMKSYRLENLNPV